MPPEPGESEAERLNRNFDDLLQELRVSQNGTQILFAFLLTVPFSNGWSKVSDLQRGIYFAALLLAALSAAMLIAPAVMHRILFRQHHKHDLVYSASRVALGGQTILAFAVGASVFLVADFIYSVAIAIAMSITVMVWTSIWFFVLPLYIRARRHRDDWEATSST
jgi:hypothetical protein